MSERICSVDTCDDNARDAGMCHPHYERNRRHGDPHHGGLLLHRGDTLGRFLAKVDKDGPLPQPGTLAYERGTTSPCWLWTSPSLQGKGYGNFHYKGRNTGAHIASFQIHGGVLIDGLELDHLCKVRLCVNPEHLEQVTHAENIRRGNTGIFQRSKTHCPQDHIYDEQNTYYFTTPRGYTGRSCRACKRDEQRVRRSAQTAEQAS
jgi:GNAT superfamily N-acetyltransferase